MSYIALVPALIPTSQADVIQASESLLFARELQIDVVDGVFVPTVSWPYSPKGSAIAVKPYTDRYTLEIDLMVADPIAAAKEWVDAGADMLVFHVESLSLDAFVAYCETATVSIGVALHGTTSLAEFYPYALHADYIQVMGVETIGAQGQAFDPATLEKITTLRQKFPQYSIGVDGGVNHTTIQALRKAGADRFIAGSAIVKQPDPQAAFLALQSLLRE